MENLLAQLTEKGLSEKQLSDIKNNYSFGLDFIIGTTTKQTKKGKTTWNTESVTKEICSEREHNNATNDETRKFFKRIGGKESVTRSYTSKGYVITKSVSTSPTGTERTIREYKFMCYDYTTQETYLNKILDLLK